MRFWPKPNPPVVASAVPRLVSTLLEILAFNAGMPFKAYVKDVSTLLEILVRLCDRTCTVQTRRLVSTLLEILAT